MVINVLDLSGSRAAYCIAGGIAGVIVNVLDLSGFITAYCVTRCVTGVAVNVGNLPCVTAT